MFAHFSNLQRHHYHKDILFNPYLTQERLSSNCFHNLPYIYHNTNIIPISHHKQKFSFLKVLGILSYVSIPSLIVTAPSLAVGKKVIKYANSYNAASSLLAGAIAGCLSKSLTAPLEKITLTYQLNPFSSSSISASMKSIYSSEGISGLFKGNLLNILEAIPDTSIKFYTFERAKSFLLKNNITHKKINSFIAGSLAGIVTNIFIYPFQVTRTQLALRKNKGLPISKVMKQMYRENGLSSFYKGGCIKAVSSILKNGMNLYLYDYMKMNNFNSLVSGGLSTLITSTLLYPFCSVQSRSIAEGSNFATTIKTLVRTGGMKGLYKGYLPSITKIVSSNGLSFWIYDKVQYKLKKKIV